MPRLVPHFGPEATAEGSNINIAERDGHLDHRNASQRRLAVGVACGAWHTLVVTAGGRVYAFGDGFTGQLGLPHRGSLETSQALLPHEVLLGSKRISLSNSRTTAEALLVPEHRRVRIAQVGGWVDGSDKIA